MPKLSFKEMLRSMVEDTLSDIVKEMNGGADKDANNTDLGDSDKDNTDNTDNKDNSDNKDTTNNDDSDVSLEDFQKALKSELQSFATTMLNGEAVTQTEKISGEEAIATLLGFIEPQNGGNNATK